MKISTTEPSQDSYSTGKQTAERVAMLNCCVLRSSHCSSSQKVWGAQAALVRGQDLGPVKSGAKALAALD